MKNNIMNTKALPEFLFKLISTEKVRVKEEDGIIKLTPIGENIDCTTGLRGMFADFPEMSVENFLKRKHADKALDL
ncbi:MAG: hypothetical protein FWC47_11900 [Oscillospiraceae bacterium]|nr:hypothetical protein [Oscillospiraceae bacterium]